MDRSKKLDKQTLYEIYRACRLCGAGAGYKMPIIQNLIKVDGEIVELKQKILECLQLEVNSNDKMPPLICELCVDKVDDFYEFLTTCRETNTKTRNRLGLPAQEALTKTKVTPTATKVTPTATKVTPVPKKVVSKDIGTETCMLGLIEANSVKQDISLDTKQSKSKKSKQTKAKQEETKQESPVMPETAPTTKNPSIKDIKLTKEKDNKRKRESSPKRTTRQQNNSMDDLMTKVQQPSKNQAVTKPSPLSKPGPKSRKIETKDVPTPSKTTRAKEKEEPPPKQKEEELPKSKTKRDRDEESLNKLKRVKDKDPKIDLTPQPPAKKAKLTEPPKPTQPTKAQKSSKSTPKPVQIATTVSKTVQPDGVPCPACNSVLKNIVGFKNHMHYSHPVTWTPDNLACNACRDWFPTIEESVSHHKKHNNYKCLRCKKKFKNGVMYHLHIENKRCLPEEIVPDIKCDNCSSTFPTSNLFKSHRCSVQNERQPVKCGNCNRRFTLLKNLAKHESTCIVGKKVVAETEPFIEPDVKKILLPMEVRITKCDDLLQYGPVVSACTVPHRFGLDRKMSYPYMPKLRVIKQPTFNPMVAIQDEIKEEYTTGDFDWGDFEDMELKTIKKLSTLCLKVIFSEQMLGELDILDDIEIARRTALKKRIDSIIFKFDDACSNHSDSILDKNVIKKPFEGVNYKSESSDKNQHSDSTVFDETSAAGEVGKDSDDKMLDFDIDFVNNYDCSVNIGRVDNHTLNSSDITVDVNKTCDKNTVNAKAPSNEHLELNKTLNDVTSSNLSAVSKDILETDKVEVNKLEIIKNPTDTVNKKDILLNENMKFDNFSSSNDSLSENSTNDNFSTVMTANHNILSKNDVYLTSSEKIGIKSTENAKTIENTGNEARRNNVESETIIKENQSLDSENTCKGMKDNDDYNNDSNLNTHAIPSEETHDSFIESNDQDISDDKIQSESMETDFDENKLDNKSLNNEDTTRNAQNSNINDGVKNETENMDIDETCSKNSLHFENHDAHSLEDVSSNKIDTDNEQSADSYTKNPDIIKNTENNPSNDSISPQKANKSLDFSVTGILNHVTSKNLDPSMKNIAINNEKDKAANINTESIENDTKQDATAINEMNNAKINDNDDNSSVKNDSDNKNDINETNNPKLNDNNQTLDNLSQNDDNFSVKNDFDNKNDTISLSTSITERTDDTISLNSLKYTENSDKFNVNDLSDDERKLMAELDEQIGETNDKIEKLSDGRDLDNFNDGYNFD